MGENTLINTENDRYKAIGLQVMAAFLWSIGGVLIKLVDLNPLAITGIRCLIAAAAIFPFLREIKFELSFNKIAGAISYTSMVILFVYATKTTTAANAILLQYSSPIYIALFGGWLLKEKATARDWVTILCVVFGMVLFFFDDIGGGSIKGNVIAIISGIALAFNTIFMRRQKDANPLENIFLGSLLTVIVTSPFMFKTMPNHRSWISLILLGVFQLGVSYVLYAKAIKKITALEATFISLIEPILNPIWVVIMVGEIPGKFALIGGFIVLISITISCIRPNKNSEEQETSIE